MLNVAASILFLLHNAFPASAHKLRPDEGIFLGPRPGVLQHVCSKEDLAQLLKRNPRLHALMHDESVGQMKALMEDEDVRNPLIGIRASKGLEFRDIVIVDFFSDLEQEHQKPWRELLRDRDISTIKSGSPQLEGHLKLLYTAITRCARRLFFLETKSSIAGNAFFGWLTRMNRLAEFIDGSTMETAMTPDEWRSSGVDWAINADDNDESPTQALEWIDQSIYCFEQAGDEGKSEKQSLNKSIYISHEQAVGDEGFLDKARCHKASIALRVELEAAAASSDDFALTEEKEEEIAAVALRLAQKGVLGELNKLLDAADPWLNEMTRDSLDRDLRPFIADSDPLLVLARTLVFHPSSSS